MYRSFHIVHRQEKSELSQFFRRVVAFTTHFSLSYEIKSKIGTPDARAKKNTKCTKKPLVIGTHVQWQNFFFMVVAFIVTFFTTCHTFISTHIIGDHHRISKNIKTIFISFEYLLFTLCHQTFIIRTRMHIYNNVLNET